MSDDLLNEFLLDDDNLPLWVDESDDDDGTDDYSADLLAELSDDDFLEELLNE